MRLPSCFVTLQCRIHVNRTFSYLLVDSNGHDAGVKSLKDTPDRLAALTKPREPVAKRAPKKQLKEKVGAPRTHAMASRRSGACTDFLIL